MFCDVLASFCFDTASEFLLLLSDGCFLFRYVKIGFSKGFASCLLLLGRNDLPLGTPVLKIPASESEVIFAFPVFPSLTKVSCFNDVSSLRIFTSGFSGFTFPNDSPIVFFEICWFCDSLKCWFNFA